MTKIGTRSFHPDSEWPESTLLGYNTPARRVKGSDIMPRRECERGGCRSFFSSIPGRRKESPLLEFCGNCRSEAISKVNDRTRRRAYLLGNPKHRGVGWQKKDQA